MRIDEGYDFLRGRPIESAIDTLGTHPLQLGRFGKVQLVRLRGRRLSSSKTSLTPVSPGSPASTAAKTDAFNAVRYALPEILLTVVLTPPST